jgi:hypothetical protein
MRSFFNFKIVWPQKIQDALAILVQLSILVSFDFLQWPGFGCLTQFPYDTKVYCGSTLPFLFGILMWTPVLLLQCRLAWFPKECVTNEARDIKIDLKKRLRNTITSFWINILVWYETLFECVPNHEFKCLLHFGCLYGCMCKWIYRSGPLVSSHFGGSVAFTYFFSSAGSFWFTLPPC